eukprot:m.337721 g.337721  ORF g.337721 m.337721 type:complete len:626 (+) comp18216_c0_seq1:336-2213(+)
MIEAVQYNMWKRLIVIAQFLAVQCIVTNGASARQDRSMEDYCQYKGFDYSLLTNDEEDYIVNSTAYESFEYVFNICREIHYNDTICGEGTAFCERTREKEKSVEQYGDIDTITFDQDPDRDYTPYLQMTGIHCQDDEDKQSESRIYFTCQEEEHIEVLYEDFDECKVYVMVYGPCRGIDPIYEQVGTLNTKEVALLLDSLNTMYLPEIDYNITAHRVQYYSKILPEATAGEPTYELSGLLLMPDGFDGEAEVFISMHDTATDATLVPSNAFVNGLLRTEYGYYALYAAIAATANGKVSFLPDGIGMGISADDTAEFLVPHAYAVSVFNFIAGVKLTIEDVDGNIQLSSNSYVTGYGEGGFAALSVHKYSSDEKWAKADVEIQSSYPSAGPYDLGYSQISTALTSNQRDPDPTFMAYAVFSYSNLFNISNVFNKSVESDAQDWFNGAYSQTQILTFMQLKVGTNYEGLYSSELINSIKEGREDNELLFKMKENSLSQVFRPEDVSYVWLCHGEDDDISYYSNMQAFVDTNNDNPNVRYAPKDATECTNHQACINPCLAELFAELAGRTTTTTSFTTTTTTNVIPWFQKTESKIGMSVGGGILFIILVVCSVLMFRRYRRGNYKAVD